MLPAHFPVSGYFWPADSRNIVRKTPVACCSGCHKRLNNGYHSHFPAPCEAERSPRAPAIALHVFYLGFSGNATDWFHVGKAGSVFADNKPVCGRGNSTLRPGYSNSSQSLVISRRNGAQYGNTKHFFKRKLMILQRGSFNSLAPSQ